MSKKNRPLPDTLGLPCVGMDSHAHLDSEELWPEFDAVLERAHNAGLSHIAQVFLSHAAYCDKKELMRQRRENRPDIFFLLGIHPCDGLKVQEGEWDAIEQAFRQDERLVAVGEIGLDFHWEDCPHEVQEEILHLQLKMAARLDKPVAIHSRDAFAETLRILDEEGFRDRPLLWHCFCLDEAAAREILSRGWHISLPGPVTYTANRAAMEAAKIIPAERLLVETDCPYLAPNPWRGKRNETGFCAFTAAAVAEARGEDPAVFWQRCGDNARRFYGIN